jgi:hypothetical protein
VGLSRSKSLLWRVEWLFDAEGLMHVDERYCVTASALLLLWCVFNSCGPVVVVCGVIYADSMRTYRGQLHWRPYLTFPLIMPGWLAHYPPLLCLSRLSPSNQWTLSRLSLHLPCLCLPLPLLLRLHPCQPVSLGLQHFLGPSYCPHHGNI